MKAKQFNEWAQSHTQEEAKQALDYARVSEVVWGHKLSIDVISRDKIKVRKANGLEVNEVDLTLNSFWNDVVRDWETAVMKWPDTFNDHLGMSIEVCMLNEEGQMSPNVTQFQKQRVYVIEHVISHDGQDLTEDLKSEIAKALTYSVDDACCLATRDDLNFIEGEAVDVKLSGDITLTVDRDKLFRDPSDVAGFMIELADGTLLKAMVQEKQAREKKSTVALEFLYADILKWLLSDDMANIEKCVKPNDYIGTVCNMFETYIISTKELVTHHLEKNIDATDLVAPGTVQTKVCTDFIKSQRTKILCQESDLYNNIFKVMLVNLQRHKDLKWCSYMNKAQVEKWNKVVDLVCKHTRLKLS